MNVSYRQVDLLLFFILCLIIGVLQYLLLAPFFNYGFTPDDWGMLFFYKTLGDDPLSKIPYVWSVKGAYTTGPTYFIGILNHFFGMDYQSYQITNIILKILATISLYPLILIIFKRKSLAFLTAILYGMSYMASRSLEYVVKGTDYLAMILMNIFFIIYYLIVAKRVKGWWFILMSFFWFVALVISPIRIYPILILIPLIEIFLLIQNRSTVNVSNSLKRLLILYLPFLLIYIYKPSSITGFLQNPPTIYQAILNGNWHIMLTPFQGVGLTLLTNEFWGKIITNVNLVGLDSYLLFLIRGPFLFFGLFIIVLAFLKSKKPARFFLRAILLNLALSIVFYFFAIHELGIAENLRLHFDPARMYPILISGFMLAVSWSTFLEWRDLGKKDNLLLALWVSPPIILLYTFLIWLLAPFGVGFEGQQGYYLVVPSIATSLFLAAILIVILDKSLKQKSRFFKLIIICVSLASLFYMYSINRNGIYYFFSGAGINGRYAFDQERMYSQVLDYLGDNFGISEPIFFYFDVFEDAKRGTFYTESLLSNLTIRLRLKDGKVSDGCAGVFYENMPNLEKLVAVRLSEKGFIYQGFCIINGSGGNTEGVFYKPDNFYAFKLKNGQLTDIREEVLERLGFK